MRRRNSPRKRSIIIHIPGFGDREIRTLVTDYTGTLSCRGELVNGVKERLIQLSKLLDVHIVSADTHATAKKNLGDLPIIAVENGEGCSVEAIVNSHLFIHGAANALDLLLNTDLLVATLRM